MLKNILNLEGAQKLTKNEQKSIKGGVFRECICPDGTSGGFMSSKDCVIYCSQ